MIYFTVVWAGLIMVCWVIGIAVLNRLQPTAFLRLGDRAIVATWLGLVILAACLLATSLVTPLSPLTSLLVTLGLVGASLVNPRNRADLLDLRAALSPTTLLLGLSSAWLVAALTSQSVAWIDTGLYHYSSIQWLANYGSTRGIALLFNNFGFTSAWFALAAPFNPPLLEARASAVVNGFALWMALLSAIICLNRLLRKSTSQLSDWFLMTYWVVFLPILIFHPLFNVMLVSSAPDIGVMFLTGITTWSLMVTLLNHQQSPTIPLVLAASTVAIKLVAIPLLLVIGLCYLTTSKPTFKHLGIGGSLVSLIIGPFITSSLLTSGCPLYPSTLFCLNVPWAPTQEAIQQVAKATHNLTSWIPKHPTGVNPWLWTLWKLLSKDETSLLLLLLSAGTIVVIGYGVKRFQPGQLQIYVWITGINMTGILFLISTAPFSRFILPYAILVLALAIAAMGRLIYRIPKVQSWLMAIDRQIITLSSRRLLLGPVVVILVIGIGIQCRDRWILPLPMRSVPVIQKQVNNITYWSPDPGNTKTPIDNLCWSAPLPCAFEVAPDVWLRDPSQGIAGGFVRR